MLSENQIKTLLERHRSDSFFSKIPHELIIQNMVGINAENVLHATVEADYRELAKIIAIHPGLMFAEARICTIDGVIVSSSPLKYALTKLDTLAWKYFESVCNRFPKYKEQFILTVCSVEDVPDMSPLYNAYDHFIDMGKKYKEAHYRPGRKHMIESVELEPLRKSWLALGLQQRYCLPRHLLKDMCYSSPHDLIYNDVLLMTVEPFKLESREAADIELNNFEARLRPLMAEHGGLPIILFNGTGYQVVYLGVDNNIIWDEGLDKYGNRAPIFSSRSHPFITLDFPNSTWSPVKKAAEQNDGNVKIDEYRRVSGCRPDIWNFKKTLSFPLNSHTLYEERDVSIRAAKSKKLFPLTEQSGLGYDYALARGFCEMSLGLSDPRGRSCFLFAKSQEDYEGIKNLIELRIEERNELVRTYSSSHILSW